MRATTHIALAGLTAVVAHGFGDSPHISGCAALALGSLLPDIDSQHSGIGRYLKPLSTHLERRWGHRTITHSLLGMLLLAVLCLPLWFFVPSFVRWLLIGYATHLFLDMANITGVPLLWPRRIQFVTLNNRAWRVPYNSPAEFAWLSTISVLALLLVPLSIDGFSPWFHRWIGTSYGAVLDYQLWKDSYEVFAEVKGVNLEKGEAVEGRFRIIEQLGKERLLVEDEVGRAYEVSPTDSATIQARRVKVWRGQALQVQSYHVTLQGQLMGDLIASLPVATRVQVNGIFKLSHAPTLPVLLGEYSRLSKASDTLTARAATIGDLSPFAGFVITEGSAIIRAEYPPDQEVKAQNVTAALPMQSHIISIPELPSLSGLIIQQGEQITEGQLIARYVDEEAIQQAQQSKEDAEVRLGEFEERLRLSGERHQAKLLKLRQQQQEAQSDLTKTQYLVSLGTVARVTLTQRELEVRRLAAEELTLLSEWTSEKYRLESLIRESRVTIERAQVDEVSQLEQQWVRAPFGGVIGEVRVVKAGVRGVDLEVVVLRVGEGVQENSP